MELLEVKDQLGCYDHFGSFFIFSQLQLPLKEVGL